MNAFKDQHGNLSINAIDYRNTECVRIVSPDHRVMILTHEETLHLKRMIENYLRATASKRGKAS